MRVQHVLGGIGLLLGALLATACAATVDRSVPEAAGAGDDEPAAESAEEIELTRTLYCRDYPDVVECMIECGKAGIGCSPSERHPFKDTGRGVLHSCRTALPAACVYTFPNGDKCAFMKLVGSLPICVYSRG